nr:hypothetical protein [Streptomyces sp. 2131.1]
MRSDHGGLYAPRPGLSDARAAAPSVCALEPGRSSWTAPLDAIRLSPGGESATAIARRLR